MTYYSFNALEFLFLNVDALIAQFEKKTTKFGIW